MRRRLPAALLCLTLVLSLVPAALAADAPAAWAAADVSRAVSLGIVPPDLQKGYAKDITREEFCVLVVRMLGILTGTAPAQNAAPAFSDTQSSYVTEAYRLGIVGGTGGGKFSPRNAVTRQEAAVMLTNAARVLRVYRTSVGVSYFIDAYKMPDWAVESVHFVTAPEVGVMKGTSQNIFDGAGGFTRQQAMVTMVRMLDYAQRSIAQTKRDTSVTVRGKSVWLTMTAAQVQAALGTPTEILSRQGGFSWQVFAADYRDFLMVGFIDGISAAIYTNAAGFEVPGVTCGAAYSEALTVYGRLVEKDCVSVSGREIVDSVLIYGDAYRKAMDVTVAERAKYAIDYAKECFYATNAMRVKRGLAPLAWSNQAAAAAQLHSQDQARNDDLTHTGSDGSKHSTRLERQGVTIWNRTAENCAVGVWDGLNAYALWLNSADHYVALVGNYSYVGCGAAANDRVIYFTQDFYSVR